MAVGAAAAPCIHLVGAGPGDPDLLTVKAWRLIHDAEVVVHDRLVSRAILDGIPSHAALIDVGKTPGHHPFSQDRINEMLVDLARSGRRVVRLKGGDPFIFGRGGEEVEYLARHGIICEVVPGITAASACASSLGIPLTHRGLATGVRFITGHCQNDELDHDWRGLADPNTTLAVYMGLANIRGIADRLIGAGLPGSTPVAMICDGTLPSQTNLTASLATIGELAAAQHRTGRALFVIGKVVSLACPANLAEDNTALAQQSSIENYAAMNLSVARGHAPWNSNPAS
ncbi:uroporphyrinogen-III C-methyltransferase [Skermanella mucosa]|uniref:uroporphyrinogen-III C-methyltransferase n=1 Tax=Skermanella mucosa TaxID=1789672 RepID=UPI00192C05C2|nr:uroporphyrinogen-III C-methyltransferase [Skermanella mucosa]UEM20827.1 uroporphyrinogen-III C-methyltransferase [Skermanella mucosa]